MQSLNQYYIRTKNGMLQLSKGAYLTIIKRHKKSIKTLKKTKQIIHFRQNLKKVKKNLKFQQKTHPTFIDKIYDLVEQVIFLKSKEVSEVFRLDGVLQDSKIFSMRSIPLIENECDNDCSSDWQQIGEGIKKMSYSLPLAVIESFGY